MIGGKFRLVGMATETGQVSKSSVPWAEYVCSTCSLSEKKESVLERPFTRRLNCLVLVPLGAFEIQFVFATWSCHRPFCSDFRRISTASYYRQPRGLENHFLKNKPSAAEAAPSAAMVNVACLGRWVKRLPLLHTLVGRN